MDDEQNKNSLTDSKVEHFQMKILLESSPVAKKVSSKLIAIQLIVDSWRRDV